MLRDRMLGGVSLLPLYAAEGGAGSGGGDGRAAAGGDGAAAGGNSEAIKTAADAGAGTGDKGSGDPGQSTDGSAAGAAAGSGADAGKTLAGGGEDAAAAAAAAASPAKFPDNWREHLAGDDKKALADLAKYTDPNALYKSLRMLQADISSGKLKAPPAPLPKDATPEQAAEWRAANGLPANAEGYVEKLELPDGVVIGEADKPLVADFAKSMFAAGASQAEMNRAVSWFYQMQDKVEAQRAEQDHQGLVAAQGELIGEWGQGEFKTNMNAMGSLLATMPEDLKNNMLTARTLDGQMLGNSAGFIRWAAAQARELNPTATLVTPGDANAGKTVDTEIAAIEAKMYIDGQPNPGYWKGKDGAAMQARYRELVDARDKMKARGKAA